MPAAKKIEKAEESYADQLTVDTDELVPPPGAELLQNVLRLPFDARADVMDALAPLKTALEKYEIDEETGELKTADLAAVGDVMRIAANTERALTPIANDPAEFHEWCMDNGISGLMALFSYVVQGMTAGKA